MQPCNLSIKQIEKSRDEAEQLAEDAEEQARKTMAIEDEFDTDRRVRKYKIKDPEKVLVRLKVEHTGFTTLNNQRFGAQFVGKVVSGMLTFFRLVLVYHVKYSLASSSMPILFVTGQPSRYFALP